MDKGFQLDLWWHQVPDGPDFIQAQLPGQDDAAGTLAGPETDGFGIGYAGLGADVDGYFRGLFPGYGENPRIGNNQRIRADAMVARMNSRKAVMSAGWARILLRDIGR
jgi:hypothetical protein